jgi:hypothetical protein
MSLTSYLAAPSRDWNHAPFSAGGENESQSTLLAREKSCTAGFFSRTLQKARQPWARKRSPLPVAA